MSRYFSMIFLFCFISPLTAGCQNRFSQFYASPLLVNPANTGRFNKTYRTGGSFRRQINTQEQLFTQAAFFSDFKIMEKLTPQQDCFALGIAGLSEKSAMDGIRNTYLSLSAAYQKGLDEEGRQQLGLGFQTTLGQRQLLKPDYVLEDQLISWINSGYSNIDIYQIGDVKVAYIDLNAGLVYQGMINNANLFTVGISMHHITQPRRVFQGGELNVPRQTSGHLAWEKKLENSGKIYAALLMSYSERSVNNLFAGLTCELSINRNNQFSFGAWFRSSPVAGKAIVPVAGLNFIGFAIHTSYEIAIYSKSRGQKSAMEITMIYTGAKSRERFLEDRFIKF